MKQYEGKLAGILGTVIVHLVAGILFMSVKLSSLYHEKHSEFVIEFEKEREYAPEELIKVPVTLDELFRDDDRFRDIVRNIASSDVEDIDPEEYQDKVKEELIASGLLGKDNFIDERKQAEEEQEAGETLVQTNTGDKETGEEKKEDKMTANEMASRYSGPTRISYDLEGRHHLSLPIPIYKCRNSGTIVMDIIVEPSGGIISRELNTELSSTTDDCLIEAALSSLNRTRFNPDNTAPRKQPGSVTFIFVAQ